MQKLNWLLFSFKGRVNRKLYWQFHLVKFLVSNLALMFLCSEAIGYLSQDPDAFTKLVAYATQVEAQASMTLSEQMRGAFDQILGLSMILYYIFLLPTLAVDVKRMHDRDKAWYWVLIQFIPLIGLVWFMIEAGALPGTEGPNRFGPTDGGTGPNQPKSSPDQGHFEA